MSQDHFKILYKFRRHCFIPLYLYAALIFILHRYTVSASLQSTYPIFHYEFLGPILFKKVHKNWTFGQKMPKKWTFDKVRSQFKMHSVKWHRYGRYLLVWKWALHTRTKVWSNVSWICTKFQNDLETYFTYLKRLKCCTHITRYHNKLWQESYRIFFLIRLVYIL